MRNLCTKSNNKMKMVTKWSPMESKHRETCGKVHANKYADFDTQNGRHRLHGGDLWAEAINTYWKNTIQKIMKNQSPNNKKIDTPEMPTWSQINAKTHQQSSESQSQKNKISIWSLLRF